MIRVKFFAALEFLLRFDCLGLPIVFLNLKKMRFLDYSILVALKFTRTFDRYCFDRFSIVYCLFKLKRDESNSILKFCIRFDAYCSRLLSFKI